MKNTPVRKVVESDKAKTRVMVFLPEENRDAKRNELKELAESVGGSMPPIVFASSTPHNAFIVIPTSKAPAVVDFLDAAGLNTVPPIYHNIS